MIIEALQHFFFKAPKHIKDMGYVKETIAIEARFKRCEEFWAPHLEKCKEQILKAAESLPEGANIMILGSGALHDVPIDALLAQKHHITCVDIVHLPQIRQKYPQVDFIDKDITGIAEEFYNRVKAHKTYKGRIAFRWDMGKMPDLVVSLNLLSQLPINMMSFADQQKASLHESFSENIMAAHLSWLLSLRTNILLVSDMKRDYFYKKDLVRSDRALETIDYFDHHEAIEEWEWDVAPLGEAEKDVRICHTVGAWQI
ncbi:MAG: hypothetical protein JKY84_12405 [Emcibacteraceae bacterium]|nr:hypothetical protein [Emcibacteraceae bacterium]